MSHKAIWIKNEYSSVQHRNPSVPHQKAPQFNTKKPFSSRHPTVPHQKRLCSTHLNWGIFGVELGGFWCWTNGCVELRGFSYWTEGCVGVRGFLCRTEGFWGLKRSYPFVLNWCVKLRELKGVKRSFLGALRNSYFLTLYQSARNFISGFRN